uniref:Deoxyuridine 5'-triphosphate nucleotidohydrolase n=1 Tax=Haematococcus lacustris TaxID=44745 RepID=A0A2K9YRW7_HAELA|nr:deoxyuridine 5'-triphosphate nucleotidohydrolase Dut [Haematococcus lacustris]AUW36499.1 deoxyuridine 5'-triphosphate nucleotidohydrolase Dut [Haematococcus lacustris]
MPTNLEAQIRSKSGLATLGIIVLNAPGTIDSDYKGEIFVILHNVSKLERIIKPAQSIAQIVFSSIYSETISGEVLYKEAYRKGGLGSTTE